MNYREIAGLKTRRGGRFDPPFIQTVPPTDAGWPAELVGRRRRLFVAVRRGQAWEPPWSPGGPPPDTISWSPTLIVAARRRAARVRVRWLTWPLLQALAPQTVRPPRRWASSRRGRLLHVPAGGADLLFGLWKPPLVARRVRLPLLARRGARTEPPWAQQAAPAPPAWPPVVTAHRRIFAALRRGKSSEPPWPASPPPTLAGRKRRQATPLRRARPFSVPGGQASAPSLPRPRMKPLALRRGHRADAPPAPPVVPVAPTWPPQQIAARRRFASLRRGRLLAFPLPQVVARIITGFFGRPSPAADEFSGEPGAASFGNPHPGGGILSGSPDSGEFDPPNPGQV